MEERLKNMIFINICEACLLYFRKNTSMTSFTSWCQYHKNYILNHNINLSQIPKNIIELQFHIFDYIHGIYGFSDEESLKFIYDFFANERWNDLYEIANFTLYVQENNKLG